MGLNQPGVVLVESAFDCFLNEAVSRGVTFLFLPEPQGQQDTQPIRLQSQDRVASGEKENLLGPRLTNARKFLEGFLRLGKGQLEYGTQIAVKLLKGDLRTLRSFLANWSATIPWRVTSRSASSEAERISAGSVPIRFLSV